MCGTPYVCVSGDKKCFLGYFAYVPNEWSQNIFDGAFCENNLQFLTVDYVVTIFNKCITIDSQMNSSY